MGYKMYYDDGDINRDMNAGLTNVTIGMIGYVAASQLIKENTTFGVVLGGLSGLDICIGLSKCVKGVSKQAHNYAQEHKK